MRYPDVMTEEETLHSLIKHDGYAAPKYRGMARFGDGDFNILRCQADKYQKHEPALAYALAECLVNGSNKVLNCLIPPPKDGVELAAMRWHFYTEMNAAFMPFLQQEIYGSSNISRMDSRPNLHTLTWWRACADLWRDKDVTLVRGSERSLTYDKLMNSPGAPKSIVEVITKPKDSWTFRQEIFDDIRRSNNEVVLLCTGMVTRPLVHDLVEEGHCAYDMGHLGLWFKQGHPIALADCPR